MFNRRFIPHQPDFQMRRGGTYKTYESHPFFDGLRIMPFPDKNLLLLGRAAH